MLPSQSGDHRPALHSAFHNILARRYEAVAWHEERAPDQVTETVGPDHQNHPAIWLSHPNRPSLVS